MSLYTTLGRIRLSAFLHITIDVSTNNENFLNDEFYIGIRHKRATGQEYGELLDEFMTTVEQMYGEKVLVQVGNVFVSCKRIQLLALEYEPPRTKAFKSVETSLRGDAIASAGFQISRSKMVVLISSGDVRVNWTTILKRNTMIKPADIISVSQMGRLKVDPLNVKVNKLSSRKTQLPYDYYYLNYYKPKKIENNAENLGEVLRGDQIENLVYTHEECENNTLACRVNLDVEYVKDFKEKIYDEYRVNMILDNIPIVFIIQRINGNQLTTYEHGFRVRFKGSYSGRKEEKYFIHNYLCFKVMYHKDLKTNSSRIVGFEVSPNMYLF